MTNYHTPVLLAKTLELLRVRPGKRYLDATLGGGGHTQALLAAGGTVLALDVDSEAIEHARTGIAPQYPQLILEQQNFRNLSQAAASHQFSPLDGILFDLGVSSWQLDQPQRGFSFTAPDTLDMRMDPNLTVQAKDLLAALGQHELAQLFTKYGDEPRARQIARLIVEYRKVQPITSGVQLATLIADLYRHPVHGHLHPATKVFQALRIAVNDELFALEDALPQAFELLTAGGRLVVISFHSGEDRIVKTFFKQAAVAGQARLLTKKPLVPSETETAANPRSRSAKLRALEKI